MVKHTLGEGLTPRVRAEISSEPWDRGGRGGRRERGKEGERKGGREERRERREREESGAVTFKVSVHY